MDNMRKRNTPEIDKHHYLRVMAENLPVLRAKLIMTQTELADIIGVSRQTIATAETGAREMSWNTFISLLFLFMHNDPTNALLPILGIYTPEISNLFTAPEIKKFNSDRTDGSEQK